MVMSATTLVPVEEYLRYSDKPIREYCDGVLYPKPLPTTFHGLLEFMLVAMLRKLGIRAAPEVTVRLSPTKIPRAGRRRRSRPPVSLPYRASSAVLRNPIAG